MIHPTRRVLTPISRNKVVHNNSDVKTNITISNNSQTSIDKSTSTISNKPVRIIPGATIALLNKNETITSTQAKKRTLQENVDIPAPKKIRPNIEVQCIEVIEENSDISFPDNNIDCIKFDPQSLIADEFTKNKITYSISKLNKDLCLFTNGECALIEHNFFERVISHCEDYTIINLCENTQFIGSLGECLKFGFTLKQISSILSHENSEEQILSKITSLKNNLSNFDRLINAFDQLGIQKQQWFNLQNLVSIMHSMPIKYFNIALEILVSEDTIVYFNSLVKFFGKAEFVSSIFHSAFSGHDSANNLYKTFYAINEYTLDNFATGLQNLDITKEQLLRLCTCNLKNIDLVIEFCTNNTYNTHFFNILNNGFSKDDITRLLTYSKSELLNNIEIIAHSNHLFTRFEEIGFSRKDITNIFTGYGIKLNYSFNIIDEQWDNYVHDKLSMLLQNSELQPSQLAMIFYRNMNFINRLEKLSNNVEVIKTIFLRGTNTNKTTINGVSKINIRNEGRLTVATNNGLRITKPSVEIFTAWFNAYNGSSLDEYWDTYDMVNRLYGESEYIEGMEHNLNELIGIIKKLSSMGFIANFIETLTQIDNRLNKINLTNPLTHSELLCNELKRLIVIIEKNRALFNKLKYYGYDFLWIVRILGMLQPSIPKIDAINEIIQYSDQIITWTKHSPEENHSLRLFSFFNIQPNLLTIQEMIELLISKTSV